MDEMGFTGRAVEVYPRWWGERIDFAEIVRAARARGLRADIDARRNQVWCEPADVAALVDIINRLGHGTNKNMSDDDRLFPLGRFAYLAKPDTLRRAASQGRLRAEKFGRNWFTSEREVIHYLNSRYHRSKRR